MTSFFHFCNKFYIQTANFCVLCKHFEKFNVRYAAILTLNILWLKIALHTEWPPFWEYKPKKDPPFQGSPRKLPTVQRANMSLQLLEVESADTECPLTKKSNASVKLFNKLQKLMTKDKIEPYKII